MNRLLRRCAWLVPAALLAAFGFSRLALSSGARASTAAGVTLSQQCPRCKGRYEFAAKFTPGARSLPGPSTPKTLGVYPYPVGVDTFMCPRCNELLDLAPRRAQIERVEGHRFVP